MVTPRSLNGKWQSQGIKPRVVMVKKKRERKEKKKKVGGLFKKRNKGERWGVIRIKRDKRSKI